MSKRLILSVGREFGSGGHAIAEGLAKRFSLEFYDSNLLEHIAEQPEVTITWFCPDEKKSGGAYVVTVGRLKRVDETAGTLRLADGMTIALDEIVDLQSDLFQGLL